MGQLTHEPLEEALPHCRHSELMRHDHVQDRWENPEEEYFLAKHAPEAAGQGSDSSSVVQARSRVRRMHPFGQGIR